MKRIDYGMAKPTWQLVKRDTKRGEVQQWRLMLRYWDGDKRVSKSKLFPPSENEKLGTKKNEHGALVPAHPGSRANALRDWIKELNEEQDRVEAAEKEQEAKRRAEEEAQREAEAQRLAEEERAKRPAAKSVADYASSMIESQVMHGTIRRSTASGYRGTIKRIREALPMSLDSLTTADVQEWLNSMADEGLASRTILKHSRFLDHVCRHAVESQELPFNPCRAATKPRQADPDPNALTAESAARLVATLEASEPTPTITAAALALFAGLRVGECCGLRWSDYDESKATITTNVAIGRDNGTNYESTPKTKRSRRTISVSRSLAKMLKRRRRLMEEELETIGITLDDAEFGALYVCGYADGTGRYYSPALISRGWMELSSSWGLMGTKGRRCVFHDLRHSAATLAINEGVDVGDVSKMLGHSRRSTTVDFYLSDRGDAANAAVSAIENAIQKQDNAQEIAVPVEALATLLKLLQERAPTTI